MNGTHVDTLLRSLITASSRRGMLGSMAGSAFGIVTARLPGLVDAKKKRRKRKSKRNEFGCLDVGKTCAGQNAKCCSGVCKGKKRRRRCKAHDGGGCETGQQRAFCDNQSMDTPCTTTSGEQGLCDTTTGNAGYCAVDFGCFPCRKDADCRPFCGSQAACIQCVALCVLFEETTACAGPSGCSFP